MISKPYFEKIQHTSTCLLLQLAKERKIIDKESLLFLNCTNQTFYKLDTTSLQEEVKWKTEKKDCHTAISEGYSKPSWLQTTNLNI